MNGLDTATGIAGLLTLAFACLQGCIKGFTLLRRARSHDRDVKVVSLMIELEEHKLQTWAEEVGLFDDPPNLRMNARDARLVPKILERLQNLLLDVNGLKKRYNLDIREGTEMLDPDECNSVDFRLPPQQRKSLSKLFGHKPGWRKWTWIAFEEKNVRKLMEDVKVFVDQLRQFLEHERQIKMEQRFDVFLRTTVVKTANEQELGVIGRDHNSSFSKGAVPAAARLKRQGLLLGVTETCTDSHSTIRGPDPRRTPTNRDLHSSLSTVSIATSPSASSMSMRLNSTELVCDSSRTEGNRYFAWYAREPVLLEWKSGGGIKLLQLENRLDRVSAFLHELEPSFHSLPCRGYIKDWSAKDRYAYVFDLPFSVYPPAVQKSPVSRHMDPPSLPSMYTLRDMLERPMETPSLNLRLSYAITLLETLLQIHTADWLHKELRSNNILFIRGPQSNNASDEDILLSPIYVAGYVYARVDHPNELTEPTGSHFENNLYRHPLSMGSSRVSYRKSFDIFSVGCVLLELGLWKTLPDILRSGSRDLQRGVDVPNATYKSPNVSYSSSSVMLTPRSSSHSMTRQSRGSLRERQSRDSRLQRSVHSVDQEMADDSPAPDFDLLELRHQLLLSNLTEGSSCQVATARNASSNDILKSLKAAAGIGYAGIVESFLGVVENMKATGSNADLWGHMDEHEYALKLEMESLDSLRAIARVI
ncbi:uncharacterized protein Z520_00989 [Fonsecaea multimorphosa CBS 102226]|uniref:Prion-inhibition and propagation HeLo domain-containing protein n=1 Tax=Fonsecaea multimorphosa CBS 102226 TaxID=1442371 RepID=A0A0D2L0I3_9EURO|nr:uncharacterized protein Z520_00989 [Fonsecaea multimorphosa CBS 102226]KIY02524.1 hypothetical protein Z520_00989 [Fonsecaea multimorphosa CBS 102226]OAL31391.1 hypothetical protein AYO22_00983 [Fonsecaea multimorphosa]